MATKRPTKQQFDNARARLIVAEQNLQRLRARCVHTPKRTECDTAECGTCGENLFGWFCVDSPTLVCEYGENDPHNDCCIHCGAPEERK